MAGTAESATSSAPARVCVCRATTTTGTRRLAYCAQRAQPSPWHAATRLWRPFVRVRAPRAAQRPRLGDQSWCPKWAGQCTVGRRNCSLPPAAARQQPSLTRTEARADQRRAPSAVIAAPAGTTLHCARDRVDCLCSACAPLPIAPGNGPVSDNCCPRATGLCAPRIAVPQTRSR